MLSTASSFPIPALEEHWVSKELRIVILEKRPLLLNGLPQDFIKTEMIWKKVSRYSKIDFKEVKELVKLD